MHHNVITKLLIANLLVSSLVWNFFLPLLHCAISSNHYQAPNCRPACFQWLPKSSGAIDLWIAAAIVEIGCTGYNSLEESTWCNYRCICSPSSRGFIEPRLQCNPLVDIHYLSDLFPGLGLMIQLLGGWVFCITIFCIADYRNILYHDTLYWWPSRPKWSPMMSCNCACGDHLVFRTMVLH